MISWLGLDRLFYGSVSLIASQFLIGGSSARDRGSVRTQVFLEHETGTGLFLVLNWATHLQFRQKPGFLTPHWTYAVGRIKSGYFMEVLCFNL